MVSFMLEIHTLMARFLLSMRLLVSSFGSVPDYNFTPHITTSPFLNRSRTEIMDYSYWCTQKNSILDMMNGKKNTLALTPCIKSECDLWRDGECIQIRKTGKPDKPQVLSR
jgi:hypothetical protein